jgi:hypothetical protein
MQVDQLAAKSIAEVLSEPEGQRLQQQEFVHVDAEAPLSYASGKTTAATIVAPYNYHNTAIAMSAVRTVLLLLLYQV